MPQKNWGIFYFKIFFCMLINLHTHHKIGQKFVLDIGLKEELIGDFSFSAGLHPWYFGTENLQENLIKLESIIQNPNCFAIGEIGLDKFSKIDINEQKEVFDSCVKLAKKYNKSIIIHSVKMYNEIIQILKNNNFTGKVFFHSFNANSQITKQLIKNNNFFYSISELSLRNSDKIKESLQIIPVDKLFVETDDNPNGDLMLIIKKISELINVKFEDLKSIIQNNCVYLDNQL